MDDQKSRISAIVQYRLYPERFKQHGMIQNGVLTVWASWNGQDLPGRRDGGRVQDQYWYAKPTSLIESRIGNSEANIREIFSRAYAHRPLLFFLDEIDSIGAQRQQLSRNDDVGGGAKLYNSVVTELMQCIDQYRGASGFSLMARRQRVLHGQHQIHLVEQVLMLMSQLDPGNQVFLVGTTNHIDDIDPRALRGGRFTEKIEVGIPDDQATCD